MVRKYERMKEKFLEYSINGIKKKYPDYDEEKLEIIAYGLEALYITITKTIVIFSIALILGIIKEVFLILIFYNILRTTAFGMHAKKSSHCYIISIVLFIGMGLICKYIDINIYVKVIISILSFITLVIYAPADTYKRPLLNEKKRRNYKIITIINGLIYLILIIVLRNNEISNFLFMGILDTSLMIHPITYRVFQLPYNNYKEYGTTRA